MPAFENYMNDAPPMWAFRTTSPTAKTPIVGKALPILGLVAFLDLNWSSKVTSTIGYSRMDIDDHRRSIGRQL